MSNSALRPRLSRVRTAAVALVTAVFLAFGATAALAHDPLATANAYVPANGSVVDGALPATILVSFQDTFRQAGNAADPSVPVARVLDAAGADHAATAVQNPNNAKQLVITTKNRTTAGKYTVTWTITASDGHAVSNDGSDVSEEGSPLVFTVHTSASAAAKASTGTTTTSSSNTVIATTVGVILVILIAAGAVLFWFRRQRDNLSKDSDSCDADPAARSRARRPAHRCPVGRCARWSPPPPSASSRPRAHTSWSCHRSRRKERRPSSPSRCRPSGICRRPRCG